MFNKQSIKGVWSVVSLAIPASPTCFVTWATFLEHTGCKSHPTVCLLRVVQFGWSCLCEAPSSLWACVLVCVRRTLTVLRKIIGSDVSVGVFFVVFLSDEWFRDNQAFPTVWKQQGNSPKVTSWKNTQQNYIKLALDFQPQRKWRQNFASVMFSAFCWRRPLAEKRRRSTRRSTRSQILQ